MATGFSVGAVEALEAAIVPEALLPNDFQSTVLGMGTEIAVVVAASVPGKTVIIVIYIWVMYSCCIGSCSSYERRG
jgi:hypothetical protein